MGATTTRSGSQPDELRALGRLGFDELAGAVGGIGQMHKAISDRVFWATGPGAAPVRLAHDAIAGGVYAGVRAGATLVGLAADAALALRRDPDPRPLSRNPHGGLALGAINGLIGDALERDQSALGQEMSVRVRGEAIPPERAALADAFAAAGPRPVIFVHGLMGAEHTWWLKAREQGGPYGARLERDLGVTPLYLRYNTGRHISENGRSLGELIEALVAAWPAPVEQVALVGHSMGGLVARSACHHADLEGAEWVRRVRHVVTLGTPHLGAPLAQAVHYASAALWAVPETRPLASFLRRRSAGIRDLRHGSLVDADWRDRDADALRAVACEEVALLDGATHCFVAATITRSPRHPLGRLVGDSLVLVPSASGRGRARRIPFRDEHGAYLGGAHHLALLNHPAVYERLRDWLGDEPAVRGRLPQGSLVRG
jgi:pimeloyl-ACP methyl ester carboxylesterase